MKELYDDYQPGYVAPKIMDREALIFAFNSMGMLLVKESMEVPAYNEFGDINIKEVRYMGRYKEIDVYSALLVDDVEVKEGYKYENLMHVDDASEIEQYALAFRIKQLMHFYRIHKYCGVCGSGLGDLPHERALKCPDCGELFYPTISPAIIVGVIKDGQILLGRSVRNATRFSTLAGFVEPGETLEECVKREIKEEVALDVKNIRYLRSQPWPFPNSLMVGFVCDYDGGEIVPQPEEIAEADWFYADELPMIPGTRTIAGVIIRTLIEEGKVINRES